MFLMACVNLEMPYVNSLYLDRCFWILMGRCYPGEVVIVVKFSLQVKAEVLNLNFEFVVEVNWCRVYL
jgi:hypothetical protein